VTDEGEKVWMRINELKIRGQGSRNKYVPRKLMAAQG
jgi:hypothetical protein